MAALMIQGTSSGAGKSLLTTGLGRAFRKRGVDVVPFKAQNMSNNARVVKQGEIGSAQYMQALACRVEPDVLMNPVLVKPEGDDRSQLVVLGKPDLDLSRLRWRERSSHLWPVIERSLRQLLAQHQLVLLEGAGSPAEINLSDIDLANMRPAMVASARVVLVTDVDRGGAFAHLYGTWAMLPQAQRGMIAGFVLNKFRGDRDLLPPAPEELERLTGIPTLGVLPWLHHGLPDEDGAATPPPAHGRPKVAIVRYPTASNLDEFKQLEQVADVRWIDRPAELDGFELLILPGSKHVAADLSWLSQTGLAEAVSRRAAEGRPILGICGGLQMLGQRVEDKAGVDGSADGLGLLPLRTTFIAGKRTEHTTSCFKSLPAPWQALAGKTISGYQIRHGRTTVTGATAEALHDGLGYVDGSVLGIYLHGVLEDPEILRGLLASRPLRSLEEAFDELADAVERHLDVSLLMREAGIA